MTDINTNTTAESSSQTGSPAQSGSPFKTVDLALIALFVALMAICSWISIPIGSVPITLQTFAVFVTVAILGGMKGTIAVAVYILLGAVGVPVFSNMQGGIGVLLGQTGGYIIGFIASSLIMWGFEKLPHGKTIWMRAISMVIGLIACYAFGTAWFMQVYTANKGAVELATVLGWCVIPFILPDAVKIALALFIGSNKSIAKLMNKVRFPEGKRTADSSDNK